MIVVLYYESHIGIDSRHLIQHINILWDNSFYDWVSRPCRTDVHSISFL